MITLARTAFLALITALVLPLQANAQFAGDAFFETPSVAVVTGETGVLELAFFAAANPFGVAQMRLSFDADDLEIVDIELPDNPAAVLRQEVQQTTGAIDLIVVNTSAIDEPIGTVQLARITVRALAAVGTVVPINALQLGAFDTAVNTYPRSGATNAEIVVTTAPVPNVVTQAQEMLDPIPQDLLARAATLAPPGSVVDMVVHNTADRSAQRVTVRTPAADVPSEAN